MQPWTDVRPGMSMGPWGLHYERTQTWWEQSRAWHEYLARCQFLLQQGLFVADMCFLVPEMSPQQFKSPVKAGYDRPGYNFDGCPPEVVLTRMKVQDGRITLPDGMSYRLLVLPQVETMTPGLLRKIKELVADGATVVGAPPVKSPSLSGYPKCDDEVRALAAELWGTGEPLAELSEHSYGKGRIFWGGEFKPKQISTAEPVNPLGSAKWIWRKEGNPAASAPPGKRYFRRILDLEPDGSIASARLIMTADNSFECWVNGKLAGSGDNFGRTYDLDIKPFLKAARNLISVLAVNATDSPNPAGLIGMLRIQYTNGRAIEVPTDGQWQAAEMASGNWTTDSAGGNWASAMELGPLGMAPWGDIQATPEADPIADANILCRLLERLGVPPDFNGQTRNSPQGLRYIHRVIGDTDIYFVANKQLQSEDALCAFRVSGKRPELWWPDTGRIERTAVYDQSGSITRIPVHLDPCGSVFVIFRKNSQAEPDRVVSVTRNGQALIETTWPQESSSGKASVPAALQTIEPPRLERSTAGGELKVVFSQPGQYTLRTANGRSRDFDLPELPKPVEVGGPWDLSFAPNWGAPAHVTLERLMSWSEHRDPGVKYFSGSAVYRKTLTIPANLLGSGRGLLLDLGKVAVMAEVKLNGKDLGILWKPPFTVEITDAVKPGDNALEVKVVNLWINRQIGDEQLPDDSDRNPEGTLKSWPTWLQEGKPSPTGRYTFTSWRLWKKNDRLVESGLLGPVTWHVLQRATITP